jgi:hypothetical protein
VDSQTCRERAAEDRRVAEQSTLPLERQKFLTSAKQWDHFAAMTEKAEREHGERIAANAAKRGATA